MQLRVFQLKNIETRLAIHQQVHFKKRKKKDGGTLPTAPAFFGGVNTFNCLSGKVVAGTSVASICIVNNKEG
jgi:hypothetical protein